MDKSLVPVLAVALLTWGGVFVYFLRLEKLARDLERELQTLKSNAPDTTETAPRQALHI